MRFAARLCIALLISAQASAVFSQTPEPAQPAPATSSTARASPSKPAASPIQTQFKAYKVIFLSGGKEELEPASSVSPGDVVEYVAVHRNVSGRRLLNTDFAIPIPHGMTLWQGSVQPASGVLKMPEAANQEGKAPARGSDRARVVWRVDKLDPMQSVEFKLRVSIDPDPSLTPAPAPNPFRPSQPQLRRP
jgi:uncharacterized repeat protein (TIGR01451 family)